VGFEKSNLCSDVAVIREETSDGKRDDGDVVKQVASSTHSPAAAAAADYEDDDDDAVIETVSRIFAVVWEAVRNVYSAAALDLG